MHTPRDGRGAVPPDEFEELAQGIDPDEQLPDFLRLLLLGQPGESGEACSGRLAAARGILADLEAEAPEIAAYATALIAEALAGRAENQRTDSDEAAA